MARYGEEEWEAKLKMCTHMSSYVSIADMITHIYDETALLFKGTTRENDWVFYHDSLSLMTAKETRKWMKDKGYLDKWILPEGGSTKTRAKK